MEPFSPEQRDGFCRAVVEKHKDTFVEAVGVRLVDAGRGWTTVEMPHRPDLTNPTGVLHGGALIMLADTAATWASFSLLCDERGKVEPTVSSTTQASANLIGNVTSGAVRADARVVHPGRSTHVVETRVTSEAGKLLLLLTTTHFIARGAGANRQG